MNGSCIPMQEMPVLRAREHALLEKSLKAAKLRARGREGVKQEGMQTVKAEREKCHSVI